MRSTRVLAACAALALTFAACGDDDDDAGGDTGPGTVAAGAGATITAAGGGATTAAPAAAGDEQVAADCAALLEVEFGDSDVAEPEVGDELTDEYKDFLRQNLETIEDVDLESDAVEDARDELADFVEDVIDSDTWTEDLDARSDTAIQPLLDVCAPFAAAAASVPTS